MDTTGIDPQMVELGARLGAAAARNTATAIFSKIRTVKARKVDKETIDELEEIVQDLISDRNELIQISKAYEQELVAQRISDEDITYIIDSVIPVLKEFVEKAGESGDAEAAQRMQEGIDALTPLLSVEMLTVLQLVGFNFKKAIGEPLTLLVRNLIMSQARLDMQSVLENNRITSAANLEMLKIAQDESASERLKQVLDVWRTTPSSDQ